MPVKCLGTIVAWRPKTFDGLIVDRPASLLKAYSCRHAAAKNEEMCLRAYQSVSEARNSIGRYLDF